SQLEDTSVIGVINGKVKGGFTVDIASIRAFLPGSLIDVRPIRETAHLEGKELEFKVIKLDQKRNNIVVSRKAVMEAANSVERDALLESLQEGMSVKGVVKNLTDYGAFVDLGGVDGLLHITDMSWKRIKHPSEIVEVGHEIDVKILKFDRERNRVSLGLKQLGDDPWVKITNRYPQDSRVTAKVTNLTDYGCFAELEEGVEGLVHVSEMDWTNKNVHPSKVVQLGDEVEVMVLEIDQERRRISLGIKQCQQNPWDAFGTKYAKGEKISGTIKSITDFGIFIGLEGEIDGLVHLSDISWNEIGEEAVRSYNRGDEIETLILSIDSERERISLGIKQLDEDPFMNYTELNEVGSIVVGEIVDISSKSLTVKLAGDVNGVLKANELALEAGMDMKTAFKIAEKIESKIISVDKKSRVLALSVKAKNRDDEQEAIQVARDQEEINSPGTIGDLIKAKMDS
ncbi:MAG: 30S ribosomal protein S1, partial [Halieaceae bacterium]|nr:30S ribosomal protein S1 [Halieaceae bacterium]